MVYSGQSGVNTRRSVPSVCGQTSGQAAIHSRSFWGSPGTHTRQPEPDGSHIDRHMQRCPGCGYCAPDISDERPALLALVKTDSYRSRLGSPDAVESVLVAHDVFSLLNGTELSQRCLILSSISSIFILYSSHLLIRLPPLHCRPAS
jgi:hypothetical protein